MLNKSLFSTGNDDWETPDELFNTYNEQYSFVLDAAGNSNNHKCPVWFGPDSPVSVTDALAEDAPWQDYLDKGQSIWLNPPYSRGLQYKFIEKVVREKKKSYTRWETSICWTDRSKDGPYPGEIVCLLPARTDTRLFHDLVIPNHRRIHFLKGRLRFKGAKAGAPFPSMIVVF